MTDTVDRNLAATGERMEARRTALVQALPADLTAREDALPARIRSDNASASSKLGRIYALLDEFSAHRAGFVACKKGCSDCCRMNVRISNLEAARIGTATGRRPRPLAHSVQHATDEFEGQACPFLDNDACSIYAHRPFVCRNHASFDVDAYWCEPGRMHAVTLPMLQLGGAEQAQMEVLKQTRQPVLADIRDFFPQRPNEGQ